jgi:hypothetical protein
MQDGQAAYAVAHKVHFFVEQALGRKYLRQVLDGLLNGGQLPARHVQQVHLVAKAVFGCYGLELLF